MTVSIFSFGISREETSKTKNKSYINGFGFDKIAAKSSGEVAFSASVGFLPSNTRTSLHTATVSVSFKIFFFTP